MAHCEVRRIEVVAIAYWFWGSCIIVITLIFWRLWKYAAKIEMLEAEERQWLDYLDYLWRTDPYSAQQWQSWFEQQYM